MDGGHIQGLLTEKRNEVNCYLGVLERLCIPLGPLSAGMNRGKLTIQRKFSVSG